MSRLTEHPLVRRLLAMDLPAGDFAVFGSGPLLAHGLDTHVNDLDIIARGAAWAAVSALKPPVPAPSGNGAMVEFADGTLQVFNAWVTPDWDIDRLIDAADVIDGIRFVTLPAVLKWKGQSRRPKDARHRKLIEQYLSH